MAVAMPALCTLPSWPHPALQADIVVLATGYRATASSLLLPEDLQASAGYKGHSQWLYR